MQGLVSEDTVKDCASRLFMVRMKLGEFDPADMNPYKKYVYLMLVCSLVPTNDNVVRNYYDILLCMLSLHICMSDSHDLF